MNMFSRFNGHFFLHGKEDAQDVLRIVSLVSERSGISIFDFKAPQLPEVDAYEWMLKYIQIVPDHSVFFGFGIGGTLAARLQEEFPDKKLSVVTVNSPTSYEGVKLNSLVVPRVALYSSHHAAIVGRSDWLSLSSQAYDFPWLQYGIKNTKQGLAYLMAAYLEVENLSFEVSCFASSV